MNSNALNMDIADGDIVAMNSKTLPGPSEKNIAEMPIPNGNTASIVSSEQSKTIKHDEKQSEIIKSKNIKAKKLDSFPGPTDEAIVEMPIPNKNTVSISSRKRSKTVKNDEKQSKIPKSKNVMVKNLKSSPAVKNKSVKRNVTHPPTSEMVIESIKAVKKQTGATFEDITKYIEEKYPVDMNRLKRHVNTFLEKNVDNEVLEKIERFKIKKKDVKKDSQSLRPKEWKKKPAKKLITSKKQVKK